MNSNINNGNSNNRLSINPINVDRNSNISLGEDASFLSNSPSLSYCSHTGKRRRSSLRASSGRLPPGSVCQGEFFRVRDPTKAVYSSACYAVPDVSSLRSTSERNRTKSLSFVGIDVAEFDEKDPSTDLQLKGQDKCNFEYKEDKRVSILAIENEETKRNDEILSRLDDDDDDDDDFSGRHSMSYGSLPSHKDALDSIPVGNLRDYLRREKELQLVNERYQQMCLTLKENKKMDCNNEVNLNTQMEIEDTDDNVNVHLEPGEIDDLINKNNEYNAQIGSTEIVYNPRDSYNSINFDTIRSPRLSRAISEDNSINDSKCDDSLISNAFQFDSNSLTRSLIDNLRKKVIELNRNHDVLYAHEMASEIYNDKNRIEELNSYMDKINENTQQIDNIQEIYNSFENKYNYYQIQYNIFHNGQSYLDNCGNYLTNQIKIYGSVIGWDVSFCYDSDLYLKYFFDDQFFFIKANITNGVLIHVYYSTEKIRDSFIQNKMIQLGIIRSIRKEYRYYEFYEMLRNITLGLNSIKIEREKLQLTCDN